jgi:hypothetical protein
MHVHHSPLVVLLTLTCISGVRAADAPVAAVARGHEAFFKTNCVACHSADRQEGQVRLDDLQFEITTLETAERWQKVLGVLNSGEMPPEDEPRPDEKAKTDLLAELSDALVVARRTIGDQGRIGVLRRLNRREYINTIRDLFGIETQAEGLPEDKGTGVFDTVGSSLYMSSDQLDRYLAVARGVISSAFAEMKLVKHPPERKVVRVEAETEFHKTHSAKVRHHTENLMKLRKWQQAGEKPTELPKVFGVTTVEDAKKMLKERPEWSLFYAAHVLSLPMADKGAYLTFSYYWNGNVDIALPPDAPVGRYVIRMRAATSDQPTVPRFMELGYLKDGSRYEPTVVAVDEVSVPLNRPQIIEFPIEMLPGSQRHYFVRERQYADKAANHSENLNQVMSGNGIGLLPSVWVDWIEWEGPFPDQGVADRRLQLLGSDEPNENDPATVRSILTRFATRAFRGVKPKTSFIDRLVAVQQVRLKASDDFMTSLVEPLAIVLASPRFLYMNEPLAPPRAVAGAPTDASAGKLLSDLDLASRLSYFLWAGPPDDQLIAAAEAGTLRTPEVLAAQVDRMIADPKALAFSTGFTHQWLLLDRLDLFMFNFRNFPKFDETARKSAKGEVYHTFHTLLRENLDARNLLDSNFVVIDSLLADYYGLTDNGKPVSGMNFRKVTLPEDSPRGGLLGMACILGMGSNGVISSPVERGAWVLRKLLNDPPPPAPANVPQLSRLDDKKLTARERLLAHQEQAQCKQCHRRIDPIGFGLENFDAAGLWREVDTYKPGEYLRRNPATGQLVVATYPIDPTGAFHNGPSFQSYFQLRDLIAARGDDFLRGMITNLYEYALGRPVSFADAEAIDGLVATAKANGGGLKSTVKALVATPEFQTE